MRVGSNILLGALKEHAHELEVRPVVKRAESFRRFLAVPSLRHRSTPLLSVDEIGASNPKQQQEPASHISEGDQNSNN